MKKFIGFIFIVIVLIAAGITVYGKIPTEIRPLVIAGIIAAAGAGIFIFMCKKISAVCKTIRFLKNEKMPEPKFAEAVDPMTGEAYTYLVNVSDRPVSAKARSEMESAYEKSKRMRKSKIFGRVILLPVLLVILAAAGILTVSAVLYIADGIHILP